MKIDLTNNEANVLVQLLDIALKSGGLSVIEPVSVFLQKIQESRNTQQTVD
jgi:hypothetical protein